MEKASTHVGASIAQMVKGLGPDPDWLKYLAASEKVSTFLGADLSRMLKAWGPATTKPVSAP